MRTFPSNLLLFTELVDTPFQLCICVDSDLNQKAVENFVQEGIIMKNFNHPHVLSLLGLCLGYKKEPMVILPFMANGDLRSYVKDKSRVSGYMFSASQYIS